MSLLALIVVSMMSLTWNPSVLSAPLAEAATIPPPPILEVSDLQNIALSDAQKYHLSPRQTSRMMATINCESGWSATSTSPTGDYGIAQINSNAHPDIRISDMLNPTFALNWMAQQFSFGHASLWVCYDRLFND